MSSEIAIRVSNLSKRYQLYDKPQHRLLQGLFRGRKQFFHEFWALRDVSFEVKKGETVGIIGRNGSGKSTLLQLVCGTLTPTSGEVEVNGRVAALLELGAGFNPEFTGRENVYMNASILGLTKEEIDTRFDAIAAFADIGEFIEQSIKTYSSGMYMRLAFSVAIHVDPEILVVDEALAVGDAIFQAKCMARLHRMMKAGVTVLFVSHDTGAVKGLCNRAMLLNAGSLLAIGDADQVVNEYTRLVHTREDVVTIQTETASPIIPSFSATDDELFYKRAAIQRIGNNRANILHAQLLNEVDAPCDEFQYGSEVRLRMVVRVNQPLPLLAFGYHVRDRNGIDVLYSDSLIERKSLRNPGPGDTFVIKWAFRATLRNAPYNIACVLSSPEVEATGSDYTSHDLVICDFITVAAQFSVYGLAVLHGFVHLDNQVVVSKLAVDVAQLAQ